MNAPEWGDAVIRLLKFLFGWPVIAVLAMVLSVLLPGRRAILAGLAVVAALGVATAMLPEPPAPCPVRLTAGDDGGRVSLAVGTECDILEVILPGNSLSTGFSWDVTRGLEPAPAASGDSRPTIAYLSTTFEPESDAPGVGGLFTLRFKSVNWGSTRLELEYRYRAEREYGDSAEQEILFGRHFGVSISVPR